MSVVRSRLYIRLYPEVPVGELSQKRALKNYRSRLNERGLARFEVLGRDADRDLIRAPAKRLAEDVPEAERLRMTVGRTIAAEPQRRGGILEALRRSPLVDADLDLRRCKCTSRILSLHSTGKCVGCIANKLTG